MDAASLLALVRFHAWANDRILSTMNGLSMKMLFPAVRIVTVINTLPL